jgi:phosphatidylglycerol:prolipoprotein diacylglycerol transferase
MSVTREPLPGVNAPRGMVGFMKDFHNRTILFRTGDVIFVTYGLIAAIAFGMTAITAFWFNATSGIDISALGKFYLLFMLPAVLLGARAFSIMLEWRQLFVNPVATLLKPGYMLHGGIFGGAVALFVYGATQTPSTLNFVDTFGVAMPLGEAIIRIGCYVYGCCWGKPTGSEYGVCYHSEHSKVVRCAPHLRGIKIHPVQMYAVIAYGGLFLFFLWLLQYRAFDGMFAGMYLIIHSIIRVALEQFRQDDRGHLVGPFTHTNLYSLVQSLAGAAMIAVGWYNQILTPRSPVSWFSILNNPTALWFAIGIAIVAGAAFGVHYKRVGSWLDTHKPAENHEHNDNLEEVDAPAATNGAVNGQIHN